MGIESIIGSGISAVGSIIGSQTQASAAREAAQIQADAGKYAADRQLEASQLAIQTTKDIYGQNVLRAAPFVEQGRTAVGNLGAAAGSLGAPLTANIPNQVNALDLHSPLAANPSFAPTIANLETTPGYQFTLDQGLKATQNSFAAQGLGTSGAAMKGGIKYAEDLASTTYQNQFSNWLNQQQLSLSNYSSQASNLLSQANIGQGFNLNQNSQIYNMLSGLSTLGANSAAGLGTEGIQASGQQNNALIGGTTAANQFLTSGAAAQSAGVIGSANANAGMFNNLGNLGLLYSMNAGSGSGGGYGGFQAGGQSGFSSLFGTSGYTGGGPPANELMDFGGGSAL